MGEYYSWVNVDRKEYICPADFGMGNKLMETSVPHNVFLCAFRELLGSEWRNSHILFLGDSKDLTEDDNNETLCLLYKHSEESGYKGIGIDTIVETYANRSGWFSAAEKDVRKEIEYYLKELEIGEKDAYNEYSVDPANPYKDLFIRKGKDYKYTVNYTKRIYYSPDDIKFIRNNPCNSDYHDNDSLMHPKIDPIPFLMRHGYDGVGDWVGDIIGVSDEIPERFTPINEVIVDN